VVYGNLKDEGEKIMADDLNIPVQGEKKEKGFLSWMKRNGGMMFLALVIILLLFSFSTQKKVMVSNECCEKICSGLGKNVSCVGRNTDNEVVCKLNYERFGMPEISELFTFKVENVTKACAVIVAVNNTEPVVNATIGDNETSIGGAV
jgi:hypothetical protein